MPVTQVSMAPSRELYDSVVKHLDLETNRPAGLILHAASELPSGEVRIIDVYDSAADLQAFAETQLFPAFAAAGVMEMVMSNERPVPYEAFDLVR